MTLRNYLHQLEQQHKLLRIREPISKTLEIAGVLKQIEPQPALFEQVRESDFRVTGNLFCSKAAFADYFGLPVAEVDERLSSADAESRLAEAGHSARDARRHLDSVAAQLILQGYFDASASRSPA